MTLSSAGTPDERARLADQDRYTEPACDVVAREHPGGAVLVARGPDGEWRGVVVELDWLARELL